jgi:hypothetical protein
VHSIVIWPIATFRCTVEFGRYHHAGPRNRKRALEIRLRLCRIRLGPLKCDFASGAMDSAS